MKKHLLVLAAIAMASIFLLSTLAVPARAETNGSSLELVAKGSVYNSQGGLLASDVWFSLRIMYKSYTVNIGNNSKGTALLYPMTTYGSTGTISAMGGPVGTISENSFYFMNVTQLYRYGVSTTSVTITASGGVINANPDGIILGGGYGDLSPGPGTTDLKMTGPNASTSSWIGIVSAVLVALLVIIGLLAYDRRRK